MTDLSGWSTREICSTASFVVRCPPLDLRPEGCLDFNEHDLTNAVELTESSDPTTDRLDQSGQASSYCGDLALPRFFRSLLATLRFNEESFDAMHLIV